MDSPSPVSVKSRNVNVQMPEALWRWIVSASQISGFSAPRIARLACQRVIDGSLEWVEPDTVSSAGSPPSINVFPEHAQAEVMSNLARDRAVSRVHWIRGCIRSLELSAGLADSMPSAEARKTLRGN